MPAALQMNGLRRNKRCHENYCLYSDYLFSNNH